MTSEGNGQKLVVEPGPLTSAEAHTLDAYWRAANYLSAAIAKMGTRNRAEAVQRAEEQGWL